MSTDHLQALANYNEWMNARLYESAAQLSTEQLNKNCGAFFGSIIGTLNHILVGDTIWLKRFSCHPFAFNSLDELQGLECPSQLNAMLYSDFEALRAARMKMDSVIKVFVGELCESALASSLTYRNTKGAQNAKNFGLLILHLFNHQTHHRGQVSTLLSQAGLDVGVTDLLVGIPDTAANITQAERPLA